MANFIALVIIFWALPVAYGQHLGLRRNRAGWAYGLLLGWLGVLILAITSYLPSDAERQVRELEAERRLSEIKELQR